MTDNGDPKDPSFKVEIDDAAVRAALESVERIARETKGGDEDEGDDLLADDDGANGAGPASAETEAPFAAARAELETLRTEAKQQKDQLLRVAAEFDNYRKRTLREKDDIRRRAREDVARDLLPILDHLDRAGDTLAAHAATPTNDPILQGVRLVARAAADSFRKLGVEEIAADGRPFDPQLHEAVMQEESAAAAPGTIVRVLEKGYRMGEVLLRPARVAVAKAPAATDQFNAVEPEEVGGEAAQAPSSTESD